MKLIINEKEVSVPLTYMAIASWGDLLNWIEREHLKAGQCVTNILINGVEEPHYRDYPARDRLLHDINEITVTTGHFDTVVRESLTELDDELKNAVALTGRLIRLLEERKTYEEEKYNEELAQLLESLKIFGDLFSADLAWVEPLEALSRKEIRSNLDNVLSDLSTAQKSREWFVVYNLLEIQVMPTLESWRRIVERTLATLKPAESSAT